MSTTHPPLEITASDLTREDIAHWKAHGWIQRPPGHCLNAGYATGDPLRHAIAELALRGMKPKVKMVDGEWIEA